MARKPRLVIPGYPHHIIQRGNNRQAIFFSDDDYLYYLECLRQAKIKCQCRIYAYVLMTNHVHLLVEPSKESALGDFMQSVGRRYVRYINETYQRYGTLWEGRYKSAVVSRDEYLIMCSRYIELNPVRARLVKDAGEYRWSSYRFRAMGEPTRILDEDVWYAGLGETLDKRQRIYGEWLIHSLREGEWDEVREATHKGSVIGQKRFQEEIELMLGRRVARKPGRPKKEGAASIENVL